MTGLSPSRTTSPRDGSGSIIGRLSGVRSGSSTMPRCRRSAATKAGSSCSWVSAPASARRSSSMASSSRWSSATFRTGRRPTRTTWACAASNATARRNGGSYVADVVARLRIALEPDDVVLGGGNVRKLKALPPGCRAGDNANAFVGGFRLWAQAEPRKRPVAAKARAGTRRAPTAPSAPTKRRAATKRVAAKSRSR